MAEVTVKQLAEVVGIPVERLLTQLGEAGLGTRKADETISDDDKLELLTFLRSSHGKTGSAGGEPKKITLRRKSVSELKQTGSQRGTSKKVNVEFRGKRTYAMRKDLAADEAARRDEESRLQEQRRQQQAKEAEKLREVGSTDRVMRTTMRPRLLKGAMTCADPMSRPATCSVTSRRSSACRWIIRCGRFGR